MACEECNERSVVRSQNRALRIITKNLRKIRTAQQEHADELFTALCETGNHATTAMQMLWDSGEFDCEPDDYDYIVSKCLSLLKSSTPNPSNS